MIMWCGILKYENLLFLFFIVMIILCTPFCDWFVMSSIYIVFDLPGLCWDVFTSYYASFFVLIFLTMSTCPLCCSSELCLFRSSVNLNGLDCIILFLILRRLYGGGRGFSVLMKVLLLLCAS